MFIENFAEKGGVGFSNNNGGLEFHNSTFLSNSALQGIIFSINSMNEILID